MNIYSLICPMAKPKDPAKLEAIYQATLQLIHGQGLSGLKMSQVSQKAGVATGTLYVYFSSKEKLINDLYLHIKRRSVKGLLLSFQPDAPFMVSFEEIWRNYMTYNLLNPEEGAFIEQYYRSPYAFREVLNERDHLLQPIFDLLDKGKSERLVQDFPTALLAAQLIGVVKELTRWHHAQRLELTPERMNQAFTMAWNSIKR